MSTLSSDLIRKRKITSLPDVQPGAPYSATLTATGSTAPLQWSVAPPLPAGLKLDAATGAISGTLAAPSAKTTYKFTVTDGANNASFTFDNFNGTLKFASDGNGGTLIFDPPKSAGPGHAAEGDNFIWISQVNQSTAGSLHDEDLPHAGTAAGQPSQMLRSFMQGPPHGEWWAEAGHHDDQLVNVIPDQLQAHLLGAVHLH